MVYCTVCGGKGCLHCQNTGLPHIFKKTHIVPPLIGGEKVSPIHSSLSAGVHLDIGTGRNKIHVPFSGQTTLPTFKIGGTPGPENDQNLAKLGGTLHNEDIFKL